MMYVQKSYRKKAIFESLRVHLTGWNLDSHTFSRGDAVEVQLDENGGGVFTLSVEFKLSPADAKIILERADTAG